MACKVSQLSAEKYHHGRFMMERLFFGDGQDAIGRRPVRVARLSSFVVMVEIETISDRFRFCGSRSPERGCVVLVREGFGVVIGGWVASFSSGCSSKSS